MKSRIRRAEERSGVAHAPGCRQCAEANRTRVYHVYAGEEPPADGGRPCLRHGWDSAVVPVVVIVAHASPRPGGCR